MVYLVYTLCALTAMTCAVLLLRSYMKNRYRLLFWSGICFVGLSVNNLLLVFDRVFFPNTVDLSTWRLTVALVALLPLLYGLIWDEE